MKTIDFRGREVELNEIVGIVYYSGSLMYAKIHKITPNGNGIKVMFDKDKTISKWKDPRKVVVKLEGKIIGKEQSVHYRTGEVLNG